MASLQAFDQYNSDADALVDQNASDVDLQQQAVVQNEAPPVENQVNFGDWQGQLELVWDTFIECGLKRAVLELMS